MKHALMVWDECFNVILSPEGSIGPIPGPGACQRREGEIRLLVNSGKCNVWKKAKEGTGEF